MQKNQPNLEAELNECEWIKEKMRSDERYAQNFYAALCNNDFQKNDVWPVLKNQFWSCSWRAAGGIVARARDCGESYMDWYCSGIRDIDYDEEINKGWDQRNFVPEGVITEEIRQDLVQMGWIAREFTVD